MQQKTKYPVLLIHGMGWRDRKWLSAWGRIPKALEQAGCPVYFGGQDSNGNVETNGRCVAQTVQRILEQTGAEKVNIIAHSKGGLDSRYAISTLNMGEKVASLTTVATPHNGSKTVDMLMKAPDFLVHIAAFCTDVFFWLLGDKKPNTYRVFHLFTTAGAEKFNRENPDREGVLYQSYACVMTRPSSDLILFLPNLVVNLVEGENDGLLTPDGVKWGEFRGICRNAGKRGISHGDEIDMYRRRLGKPADGAWDVVEFYKNIVTELADKGL